MLEEWFKATILCEQVLFLANHIWTRATDQRPSVWEPFCFPQWLVTWFSRFYHFHSPVILSANQCSLSHSLIHSFIHPSLHPTSTQGVFTIPQAGTCWRKTDPWFPRWGTRTRSIRITWDLVRNSNLLRLHLRSTELQPLGAAPELRVLTSPPGDSDAHQVGGLLVWTRPHSLRACPLLEKSHK